MKLHKPEQETHAGKSIQMACQMFDIPLSRLADHLGISRQGAHPRYKEMIAHSDLVEKLIKELE
jgi:hypothetical protein